MPDFDQEEALRIAEELRQRDETARAARPKSKTELEAELARLEGEAAIWRRRLDDVGKAHVTICSAVMNPPSATLSQMVESKALFATKLAGLYGEITRILLELEKQ